MIYDYIIIGAGAAGLHVALEFLAQDLDSSQKVLILDPEPKNSNDRTWCYWYEGEDSYDEIAFHSWEKARFRSTSLDKSYDLRPYRYKMIRSRDFYAFAKKKLLAAENITWKTETVLQTGRLGKTEKVKTDADSYQCRVLLDSRPDVDRWIGDNKRIDLIQHFWGWFVKTRNPVFDESQFTMMDFGHRPKDKTAFMYVLPYAPDEALLEFTYFSDEIEEADTYTFYLEQYMRKKIGTTQFEILEHEVGQIPMTSHRFERSSTESHLRIGAGGGWVKASTGYSFRRARRMSRILVHNLLSHKKWDTGLYQARHQWFDKIFLGVLHHDNALGERVFSQMYGKNKIQEIFRFLDEETNLWEDLKIIGSFDIPPFLNSLKKSLF